MSNLDKHDINIKAVANGWFVKVGCKYIVFTSVDEMIDSLRGFLNDRESFRNHAIENMKHGHHLRDGRRPVATLGSDGTLTFASGHTHSLTTADD